jgi:hypothetical protein
MTYSTSSCLVTKLWIHGMYICMYVCKYLIFTTVPGDVASDWVAGGVHASLLFSVSSSWQEMLNDYLWLVKQLVQLWQSFSLLCLDRGSHTSDWSVILWDTSLCTLWSATYHVNLFVTAHIMMITIHLCSGYTVCRWLSWYVPCYGILQWHRCCKISLNNKILCKEYIYIY